jgi:hypothetical protein
MVTDEDVLEKDDMHILNRMKAFVASEEVSRCGAAKPLSAQIERAVCQSYQYIFFTSFSLFVATRWRSYRQDDHQSRASTTTNHTENKQKTKAY